MPAHRAHLSAGIAGLVLFAMPASALAAVVMEFPENAALKEQMQVASVNFRSAPPLARVCTGAGGSGSVTITRPVDAMSPQLAEVSKDKKGAMVQLDEVKADGTRIAYQLVGAKINSIKPVNGDSAMEQIAVNYSQIRWITVGCAPPAPTRRAGGTGAAFGPSMPSPSYGNGY